jgi:hypothetical protein
VVVRSVGFFSLDGPNVGFANNNGNWAPIQKR